MLGCFGGFSRKSNADDESRPRLSPTSSGDSTTGPLSNTEKVTKFLKTGHLHKLGPFQAPSSGLSRDSRDSIGSRWTGSSSGASDVRSMGMASRNFYNLSHPEPSRNFMASTQLAQQIREQADPVADRQSLELWSSMSSGLQNAPSLGTGGMNDWEIDADDVQICLDSRNRPWQLGSGGFGRVFRAEMAGSTPVAVKFVNRQNPRELRRFVHEIEILRSLRHTNIVQFMGAFLEGGQMILVTEYMVGGDLYDVIGHDLNQTFSWYQRGQMVALDVVRGLVHMHARRIIHLDLKSANILLTRDGTAKIADVGLAKVLSKKSTQASMQSTFDWAAPEVLAGQTCDDKADIWSLGVVLWEIAAGECPKLRQLRPLKVPEECPQELKDLVVACRASDPADRPDARVVFKKLSAIVSHTLAEQQKYNVQHQQLGGQPLGFGTNARSPSIDGPSSPFSKQRWSQRPAWASPEHMGDEERPSSMAAIYEDNPMDSGHTVRNNSRELHTAGSLRKCTVDLSARMTSGHKRRLSRDSRSCENLLSHYRSTSL